MPEGDDRLGAQAVVERQPGRQEHARRRPGRRPARLGRMTKARDDFTADHPPARQRHHQGRQPHPDAGRADVRPQRQQVVVPAERRLGRAEPAVVVGHVSGMLGHPGHGQDVAVVGGVGADEVPPHQHRDDERVQGADGPPSRRQEAAVPGAVGGVEDVQRDQSGAGQQHAEDHREQLQRGGATAVAGVDSRREAQAGRCRPGQIGEDADDLGPEVVSAALAAQRRARMFGSWSLCQSHEFGRDPVGVGGKGQPLARRAEHLAQRGGDDRDVAHHEHQVVVDSLDEQPAVDGLGRLLGHGGQQHRLRAVLRAGESGGGLARHGDVQFGGHISDQRCLDAVERVVLRPVQLRGGLVDRQHRGDDRQQRPEQTRDDRDEAGVPVICARGCHGARW